MSRRALSVIGRACVVWTSCAVVASCGGGEDSSAAASRGAPDAQPQDLEEALDLLNALGYAVMMNKPGETYFSLHARLLHRYLRKVGDHDFGRQLQYLKPLMIALVPTAAAKTYLLCEAFALPRAPLATPSACSAS